MPAAYSADIRGRVIASVESGSSRREAAEEFDVSASSAIKWVAAYRTTGASSKRPYCGCGPSERVALAVSTLLFQRVILVVVSISGRLQFVPNRYCHSCLPPFALVFMLRHSGRYVRHRSLGT